MGLLAYGYGRLRQLNDINIVPAQGWRVVCFAVGWTVLTIAIVSPLCRMAATLTSAHMVQHAILVAVAPPLLILGGAGSTMIMALPSRLRRGRLMQNGTRPIRTWKGSLAIGGLYGVTIWLWHVPAFYQSALLNPAIHLLMYGTLLIASLLFWGDILGPAQRERAAAASLLLVATLMHTSLLGALLTFSSAPWYSVLADRSGVWDVTPLEDQQLAGLIMWVPMGAIYLVSALGQLAAWLRLGEDSQPDFQVKVARASSSQRQPT